MAPVSELELVGRVLLAVFLGFVIGWGANWQDSTPANAPTQC